MGDSWSGNHSGWVGWHWAGNPQAWALILAWKPTSFWPWARLTFSVASTFFCIHKWSLRLGVLWFRNYAVPTTRSIGRSVSVPHATLGNGQGFLRRSLRRARRCPGDPSEEVWAKEPALIAGPWKGPCDTQSCLGLRFWGKCKGFGDLEGEQMLVMKVKPVFHS